MTEIYCPPRRTWPHKFRDAGRGLLVAFRGQSSFAVHFAVAFCVAGVASWCNVSRTEWCLLILCIALVMTAELLNTSLELLAKAVSSQWNPQVRDALDVAGGAVLAASLGASLIGCAILLPHLARILLSGT